MRNSIKIGVVGASILLLSGCNVDMNSLNPFVNKKLEEMKKEATLAKEALEMNKKCISLAKNAKEANECNQKAKEHAPKLDLEDFKRWNKKEKNKRLSIIDKRLKQAECVLNAKDIQSATTCLGVDSNSTTTKK